MRSHFAKTTALICATLVTLSSVAIADEYKNSVVNLKLDKTGANNLKVTVVTDKPYKAPLVVNEKANNRYVILMPETKNELKSRPVIDNISDTVRGFSIKTQPYVSGSCKGYTKIEIVSPKAINITTSTQISVQHSQSLTTTKHSNQQINDANKKLQTVTLKGFEDTKPQNHKATVQKKSTNKIEKTANTIKSKLVNLEKTTSKKNDAKVAKKQTTKTVKLNNKKAIINKPIAPKKIVKPAIAKTTAPTMPKPKVTTTPKVVKQVPVTVKTPKIVDDTNILLKEQKSLNEETQTRDTIANEINNSKLKNTQSQQKIQKENKIKAAMSRLLNIQTGWVKLLLILSAVGFPIGAIFYIIMVNKKLKQKAEETEFVNQYSEPTTYQNMQEEPTEQDIPQDNFSNEYQTEYIQKENIPEDTFEQTEPQEEPEYTEIETIEELEDEPMIEEEEEEEEEELENDEDLDGNIVTEEDLDNIESALLNNTELEESEEDTMEEPEIISEETEDEPVEGETEEEEPLENIQSDIPQTEDNTDENIQEIEEDESSLEEEQAILDDTQNSFAQMLNTTEETLKEDETIEEPTAKNKEEKKPLQETETNNSELNNQDQIEPENKIKSEIGNSDDPKIEDEETIEEPKEEENQIESYEPDGFIEDFDKTEDDSVFDELLTPTISTAAMATTEMATQNLDTDDDNVFDELREEYEVIDGLTVLKRTDINDRQGFYLVKYEDVSSLIGFIDDDIFVIKTFEDLVNNKIFVKLADKISETTNRYIIKIGNDKMVVEVADNNMKHIIDL